jgi:hypothetical protein
MLGCCAGLGLIVLALWPEPAGVTYRNFNRVTVGMSRADATTILGGPPGAIAPNGRNWQGLWFC